MPPTEVQASRMCVGGVVVVPLELKNNKPVCKWIIGIQGSCILESAEMLFLLSQISRIGVGAVVGMQITIKNNWMSRCTGVAGAPYLILPYHALKIS